MHFDDDAIVGKEIARGKICDTMPWTCWPIRLSTA